MATSKDFNIYVLERLDAYNVSSRPMMGEYVVYCDGKVVGGIYDNRLLVKPTAYALNVMPDAERIIPYEGSKELLLVDNVDDKEFVGELLKGIAADLPMPKPKKKKQ